MNNVGTEWGQKWPANKNRVGDYALTLWFYWCARHDLNVRPTDS